MPVEITAGPVFVVGIWRSGTSLLYTLLNQHPLIALMYEADLPLLKQLFYRLPAKWLGVFLYGYILKRGYMDGRAGFHYAMAKAMYYWQIDAKRAAMAVPAQGD